MPGSILPLGAAVPRAWNAVATGSLYHHAWSDNFEPALRLGTPEIKTLADARDYIQKLPPVERVKPAWDHSFDVLIRATKVGGHQVKFARSAIAEAYASGAGRFLPLPSALTE